MSDMDFRIGPAITHFLHTQGPRGFLWRFALAYALVTLALQAISLWTQGPVYEIYLRACAENDCNFEPYIDDLNAVSMQTNALSLLMLPLTLGIWTVFEGASQRRYIRAEGFQIRLGADEGRLALVGLIWFALLVAGYFALAFGVALPAVIAGLAFGVLGGVLAGGVVFLGLMFAGLYLFARLSPASALTIRDQQIRFFEGWSLTRGQGLGLAGSYFLLMLAMMLVMLVFYALLFFLGFVLLMPTISAAEGSDVAAATIAGIRQPAFWAPMSLASLLLLTLFGVGAHALGGPAAWFVLRNTDAGGAVISETFE